jgi:uncharacterized protein with PIN domain
LTIFRDASALIAIIAGEPDAARLADALERDGDILGSTLPVWETMAGLCHACACAKANCALLLFEGNDLSQTDIANAAL